MEYWTEAAVHATLRCVLACFVLCLFSLSSFVVALFVAFVYVALVAASCFFVAAGTALLCCVCRNTRNLKCTTVENDLLFEQQDTLLMGVSALCFAFCCCPFVVRLCQCVSLSLLFFPCESDLSSEFSSLCMCDGDHGEVYILCHGIAETYVLAFFSALCPFFCIFSSFVAFALYKPDEKQDAPATPQRNLAFILFPAFFNWCCFATSTQC